MSSFADSEYRYDSGGPNHSHTILLPVLDKIVTEVRPKRLFDLGCGNGSVADHLTRRGIEVVGIDASPSGVSVANRIYPHLKIDIGSAYDDLPARYGKFDMVVSLEVIEHLYAPRIYVKNIYNLLEPGGVVVISTPYHGYVKNLVLALTGKMDAHFWALWDGGHIKFWSIKTLSALLEEFGFEIMAFHRVGRLPPLAKSMIVIARKPRV